MLIVVGFTTYYLVPYSVFNQMNTLLFLLMNLVLVLVILGLTFMCMLVFEYLETFLLWLCMQTCCRRDRRLHHVISKNMEAHRRRNSKTSIMFTLAISYLIFSASSFLLLSALIIKTAEVIIGADIRVGNTSYLNEVAIADFLDNQMTGASAPVVGYAFRTADLADFYRKVNPGAQDSELLNLSGYQVQSAGIYGVPSNFMQVIDSSFYVPGDVQHVDGVATLESGKVDPVALLYNEEGYDQYVGYPVAN